MASRGAANLAVRLTIHEVASLDTHRHTETRVDGVKNGEFKKKTTTTKFPFGFSSQQRNARMKKSKKAKEKINRAHAETPLGSKMAPKWKKRKQQKRKEKTKET